MLSQQPHSNMTDSWTCGILCYELIYGKAPFTGRNHQETYRNITKGQYDKRTKLFSPGKQHSNTL
jgi:serine/threonine protein kinase